MNFHLQFSLTSTENAWNLLIENFTFSGLRIALYGTPYPVKCTFFLQVLRVCFGLLEMKVHFLNAVTVV